MKKICIIGLGWQGRKFLKNLLKEDYQIIGCCRSVATQTRITNEFGIKVYVDYKEGINEFQPDLIISTVFPTDEQISIITYILRETNFKLLVDIPISFDIKQLRMLLGFEKLFLFDIEIHNLFFKLTQKHQNNLKHIKAVLHYDIDNLRTQSDAQKALKVDTFYMLNNIFYTPDNVTLDISYKRVYHKIKDVEYIIIIELISGEKIAYDYRGDVGYVHSSEKNEIDNMNYSNIMNTILSDIFSEGIQKKNYLQKQRHLSIWSKII